MAYTQTIILPIMINVPKKTIRRKQTKINKGMMATNKTEAPIQNWDPLETKILSPCLPRYILHCAPILKCPRKKCQTWQIFTTSQTIGPGRVKTQHLFMNYIPFICFTLLILFCMSLKNAVLIKHTPIHGNLPYQTEFSVLAGDRLVDVSFRTLWLALQCVLRQSHLLLLPFQLLLQWFHLFCFTKST